jgi:hypothetical protein
MRAVRLSALLMLSMLAGCAERDLLLVATPPPAPPPAANQRTLVETPPPATLPQLPLPALKPGTELSLAETEALADQVSPKAPVKTQSVASQRAIGRIVRWAANLSATDASLLTDADHLVSLSKLDAMKLFGPPAESNELPQIQTWTYHSAVCDLTLFFYRDGGPALQALTYEIDERGASDATQHACLTSLEKPSVS